MTFIGTYSSAIDYQNVHGEVIILKTVPNAVTTTVPIHLGYGLLRSVRAIRGHVDVH
jgi:hypothetical protein